MRDLGTILSFLAASLQGKLGNGCPPNESERQKLIDTVQAIFEQTSADELSVGSMSNALGYSVVALLGSLSSSLSVSIRLSAMATLLCLVEKTRDHYVVLTQFLPAVCSLMSKIVGNGEKEPHQLTVSAIKIMQIMLTHGIPQGKPIPVTFEQNIGAILRIVLKAAQSTEDSRVLDALQAFVSELNKSLQLEPFTHLTLQLACAISVPLNLRDSQIPLAKVLYQSTKERAEDERNPVESRIEAVKLASYIETLVPGVDECLTLVVDLVSKQIGAENAKQFGKITTMATGNLPCLLQNFNSVELPLVFGPNLSSIMSAFDRVCSKTELKSTVNSLITHKERSPETCLLLLGRSIRFCPSASVPQAADLIVDECLQILTGSSASPRDKLTSCAFMHMLVDVSSVLGGDQFDPYWRYVMMDVLTWLASPDPTMSSYAASALHLVSQSYKISLSPIDLISRHVDYVVDQLGLQIRCPTVYPLAPRILTALLSIIGPTFAGRITDVLGEVLENLYAYRSHDGYVFELLGVISAVAPSLVPPRNLVSKDEMMSRKPIPPSKMLDTDAVQLSVEQMTAEKLIAVVVHFILSDRRRIRMRSMQTLSDLALAFRSNRDAFLPLVHLTWPAMLGRVSESDPFVAGQALKTIADMAEIAGEFMQSRVNQELWPALQFLPLQSATLDCFSRITLLMGLSLKTVQGLCWSMIDALRTDSPQSLKESAIRLGEALAKSSPDTLWFVLFCQVDQTQDFIESVDTRPYRTTQSGQISRPHLIRLQQLLLNQPVP